MHSMKLRIRTPEGIVFTQDLAGPAPRFLAWLIDLAIMMALLTAMNTLLGVFAVVSAEVAQAIAILGGFALTTGYKIVGESLWRGQTLGKRVMRLRVIDAEGMRLRFSQVALRNLLRVVDMLPALYLLGGLIVLFSRRSQRLGDLAAGTAVVRIPRLQEPDVDQLVAGRFNSLRAHPHLVARLRQRTSPAEAALALQCLLRREEFEPAARVRLLAEVADHFRSLVAFPPEAVEGIADEQYLRNVVDVLYRTRPTGSQESQAANVSPAPVS
jgi:uncharacterized RDD family membrane protein YckC